VSGFDFGTLNISCLYWVHIVNNYRGISGFRRTFFKVNQFYWPTIALNCSCQTPTTHTKNITSNFIQARSILPDDGSQTIRNMSE